VTQAAPLSRERLARRARAPRGRSRRLSCLWRGRVRAAGGRDHSALRALRAVGRRLLRDGGGGCGGFCGGVCRCRRRRVGQELELERERADRAVLAHNRLPLVAHLVRRRALPARGGAREEAADDGSGQDDVANLQEQEDRTVSSARLGIRPCLSRRAGI